MREEKVINLVDGERALTFVVRQMSAIKAESFIYRVAILLAKAGGSELKDVSMDSIRTAVQGNGDEFPAERIIRLIGALDYEKAKSLMDELLAECYYIPDPSNMGVRLACTEQTLDGNITNPITIMRLRVEALKVNFGFFRSAVTSPTSAVGAVVTFPKRTKISRK